MIGRNSIRGEEGCNRKPSVNVWKCEVCAEQNFEEGKIQRLCITCGRKKGYMGSRKIKVLNKSLLDHTPHLTASTMEEVTKANKLTERKRARWEGLQGKQSLFLSSRSDFEAIERAEMKDETGNILASIRATLEDTTT